MATYYTLLKGLIDQLSPLWVGFTPPVQIGIGWPALDTLQDVVKAGSYSLINVYDGDGTRNTTRWNRLAAALDVAPPTPGVTVDLYPPVLKPSQTTTLTLAGTPNPNDSAVFSAATYGGPPTMANGLAVVGTTLDQLAAALASDINSGPYANPDITASATGAVLTITNGSSTASFTCRAGVGNVGSRLWENRRVERHVRVIAWTATEAAREAVTDPLDAKLAQLENYFGYNLANGETVRLLYHADMLVEESQLAGVYRRDFRISLEYGVNQQDALYPVLATAMDFQTVR